MKEECGGGGEMEVGRGGGRYWELEEDYSKMSRKNSKIPLTMFTFMICIGVR